MHSSSTDVWLYAVDFISVAAGISLCFVYWCMKDMAFLFVAIALICSAALSILLPAWWPLAAGWLIACILTVLVAGAYKHDGKHQAHHGYY
jgi:putative effector of murein hydrolase LrgA (UPF0299 family)